MEIFIVDRQFHLFSYARHQNDQSIDKIAMNRSELIIFLRDDNKIPEGFINEFEMNRAFREKNLLSFNGE